MRRSVKRLALEAIMLSMAQIKENLKSYGEPEYLEANSKAMKNLAMAYTLVKRGVILPDWIKEGKHDQQGSGAQKL